MTEDYFEEPTIETTVVDEMEADPLDLLAMDTDEPNSNAVQFLLPDEPDDEMWDEMEDEIEKIEGKIEQCFLHFPNLLISVRLVSDFSLQKRETRVHRM